MKPEKQKNIYSSNLMLIKLPSFQIIKAKNTCYNSRISLTSLGVLMYVIPVLTIVLAQTIA